MTLDKIILYGDNGTETIIKNIKWYSDQFICYEYNNEIQIGLIQFCIGYLDDRIYEADKLMKSKSLTIGCSSIKRIEKENVDDFIRKFFDQKKN